jgi:short-subunit dehydrogenase
LLVGKEVKWAIAGRTKSKLEQVKKDIAGQLGNAKVLDIDTLIVDTKYV